MADVGPEFIGFHPRHLLRFGGGESLARHLFEHPVHHGVVTHPDQSLRGTQAHSLKVVRQRRFPLGWFHTPMILFAAGLLAAPAQPALPPMPTTAVLYHGFASTVLAFHAPNIPRFHAKSIPSEQSRFLYDFSLENPFSTAC